MNEKMAQDTVQASIGSGLTWKTTATEALGNRDLKGKVAIVTGGYSGIGLETVRVLAKAGADVVIPARSLEKAEFAVKGIPNVELEAMDLTDPKSIDNFAERFLSSRQPLHVLINSAGIMAPPLMRDKRGYESQFATNHLGHFQLTARLLPALKEAGNARVIAVSSRAQRLGGVNFEDPNYERTEYDPWKAYAQSKSANVLFAVQLDRLARTYGVRAFAVHPGLVPTTNLGRHSGGKKVEQSMLSRTVRRLANKLNVVSLLNISRKDPSEKLKSIEQGAATSVWCATSDLLNGMGGVYCEDCDIAEVASGETIESHGVCPWAINPSYAEKLWRLSEELTGTKFKF